MFKNTRRWRCKEIAFGNKISKQVNHLYSLLLQRKPSGIAGFHKEREKARPVSLRSNFEGGVVVWLELLPVLLSTIL